METYESSENIRINIIKEQDDVLDSMGNSLTNLENMANGIHIETAKQNHELSEIGDDMDTTKSRMNRILEKIDRLLNDDSDTVKLYTIIILLLIVTALIIVLIWK